MKAQIKYSIMAVICCVFFSFSNLSAQTDVKKTESFKVYGNCGMCKEHIEGALKKKDGISKKAWNVQTKILTVTYDPAKVTLLQIKQKIADAGYDTDDMHAKTEAYNKLDKCCQYDRPKK
jgi:copper chaperone CopZ